jgi:arylformamidase
MAVWEGDPPVALREVATVAEDGVAVSELRMSLHAGTHVDAPRHLRADGGGCEAFPPERFLGPAWVLDARDAADLVPASAIARVPAEARRVLVATRAAELWDARGFRSDLVGLSPAAAEAIVRRGIGLVGIDYMSIAAADDPLPVHRTLLDGSVAILEGLDLRPLAEGWHELLVLPLLVPGADAAPARALARPVA